MNEDSITLQPYNSTSVAGDRIHVPPVDTVFPGTCTTCDFGTPSEYCEYENQYCIKLSDTSVSIVAVNGSLLYGSPYMLDGACTPRYLHRLGRMTYGMTYGIICRESSYHRFSFGEDGNPVLHGIENGEPGARSGILVRSSSGNLYHVELIESIISIHDIGQSTSVYHEIHSNCIRGSFALHPAFISNGQFHLSCKSENGDPVNRLYSVKNEDYEPLELCANPLFSPPTSSTGIDTFAVNCSKTLMIYQTNNAAQTYSTSFNSSIASLLYLDKNTLLVDTRSEQHIVVIDRFMNGNGSDGIATLEDTFNCSLLYKLITPNIYATVCRTGLHYEVRLLDKTRRQELSPITDLTTPPRNIFFDAQATSSPPSSDPTITHPPLPPEGITPSDSSDGTMEGTLSPRETITDMVYAQNSTALPPTTPTPTNTPTPTSTASDGHFPLSYLIPIGTIILAIIIFSIIASLVIILRWKHGKKSQRSCNPEISHPVQEEDKQGTSMLYPDIISQSPSTGSSNLSIQGYSHPIQETDRV